MKTKLISSIAGNNQSIDQLINEWINHQTNIKVIDIKLQTDLGPTDSHTLKVMTSALILYKEKSKNKINPTKLGKLGWNGDTPEWINKVAPNYTVDALQKTMKNFIGYLNFNMVQYKIDWLKPQPQLGIGAQFDLMLLDQDNNVGAVLKSYWKDKKLIGQILPTKNEIGFNTVLNDVRYQVLKCLPDYTYQRIDWKG